ncbi:hypothetical protein Hdeb2414_s0012g00380031 [Helianthus debilis subsp. tardiflorus]
MYLYRVRSFVELDRLPASKMYLHFINTKCFSLKGFKTCPNESGKPLIPKTKLKMTSTVTYGGTVSYGGLCNKIFLPYNSRQPP